MKLKRDREKKKETGICLSLIQKYRETIRLLIEVNPLCLRLQNPSSSKQKDISYFLDQRGWGLLKAFTIWTASSMEEATGVWLS